MGAAWSGACQRDRLRRVFAARSRYFRRNALGGEVAPLRAGRQAQKITVRRYLPNAAARACQLCASSPILG